MSTMEQLYSQEQNWLKAYESGEHVPGSNLDRCLREGLNSVRRAAIAAGPDALTVHRKMANDFVGYLSNLFQDLTDIVDTRWWEGDDEVSIVQKWQQCLWVIPNLMDCLAVKGFPKAQPHDDYAFSLKGFPSRKYLENYSFWQSSSLERILIHHLIVWETVQYGPMALATQLSIWDALAQIFVPTKSKQADPNNSLLAGLDHPDPVSSLSSLKAMRKKTAALRIWLYLGISAIIAFLFMLTGGEFNLLQQAAAWTLVPLCIGMIVWTTGSVFGWTLWPLLFQAAIKKRRLPIALLSKMVSTADRFLSITAPKEAEREMMQARADGAVWPNDSWALLYLSINRGDAFWGGELQSRPFYKKATTDKSDVLRAKTDGLYNLSRILSGRGFIDESGNFFDESSLDS
jgi:hypothetical protein